MSALEHTAPGKGAAWSVRRAAGAEPSPIGVFRPELFFLGRGEGEGWVRDAFGRRLSRVRVTTSGARRRDGRDVEIRATFAYDNGREDPWRWVMRDSGGGDYSVAEARAGAGIVGERHGSDYVIRFRRAVGLARGWAAPSFVSRLRLIGPGTALKSARIGYLGVPFARLEAVLRKV